MNVKQLQRRFDVRLLGLSESHFSDISASIFNYARSARFLMEDDEPEIVSVTDSIFEHERIPRGVIILTGPMDEFIVGALSRALQFHDLFQGLYEDKMTDAEYRSLRRRNRDKDDLFSAFSGPTNHFLQGEEVLGLTGHRRCIALTHDSFERIATSPARLETKRVLPRPA